MSTLKKSTFAVFTACFLFLFTAVSALAWDTGADVFDWGRADASTKKQMVTDLQEILIKKNILKKRYNADQLVKIVNQELKKDSEQAIIIYKMCEGLSLNCESL